MKFLHYAALILGASAVRLHQTEAVAPTVVAMPMPETLELQLKSFVSVGGKPTDA